MIRWDNRSETGTCSKTLLILLISLLLFWALMSKAMLTLGVMDWMSSSKIYTLKASPSMGWYLEGLDELTPHLTGVRWALTDPTALGWLISSTVDSDSWAADQLQESQLQLWSQGDLCSWSSSNTDSSLPRIPFPDTPAGPLPQPMAACWLTPDSQWRFKCWIRTSSGTARAPGMSSSYTDWLNGMSLLVRAWKNVVHWRTLLYSCLENPRNSMKRQKDMTLKDESPRSVGAQY